MQDRTVANDIWLYTFLPHLSEPKLGTIDLANTGASVNNSIETHDVWLNTEPTHLRNPPLGAHKITTLCARANCDVDTDRIGFLLPFGCKRFQPSLGAIDIPDFGIGTNQGSIAYWRWRNSRFPHVLHSLLSHLDIATFGSSLKFHGAA
jgi:hypothetical protein